MLSSFALIFLVGLAAAFFCRLIRVPRIIGMLLTGILLGPCMLDLLDASTLSISSDLRQIALIVILLKAGLSLDLSDLRAVGRPAILLSFLPALFEIGAVTLLAPMFLPVTALEAAVTGAVLGAVSPAIVVPRMVQLMENRLGTNKRIPQMLLSGASLDDVFVIVLFSTFTGMLQGSGPSAGDLLTAPVSIVLGILTGCAAGLLLAAIFEYAHQVNRPIRQSFKLILTLGSAFLLMAVEAWLKPYIPLSGLLAVMSMACMIRLRCRSEVTVDLSVKYGKLWLAAEVVLFVLVGAAVDIRATLQTGPAAILLILSVLVVRSIGVWLCLVRTGLKRREKLYCVAAYLPKATVQAAIGSVPMALGLPCGGIVLSVSVLSILITAPLGAVLMDLGAPRLLTKDPADT